MQFSLNGRRRRRANHPKTSVPAVFKPPSQQKSKPLLLAEQVRKLVDQGDVAAAAGKYRQAVGAWRRALCILDWDQVLPAEEGKTRNDAELPIRPKLHEQCAQLYLLMQETSLAAQHADKACRLAPWWGVACFTHARALAIMGRMDQATELLKQAKTLDHALQKDVDQELISVARAVKFAENGQLHEETVERESGSPLGISTAGGTRRNNEHLHRFLEMSLGEAGIVGMKRSRNTFSSIQDASYTHTGKVRRGSEGKLEPATTSPRQPSSHSQVPSSVQAQMTVENSRSDENQLSNNPNIRVDMKESQLDTLSSRVNPSSNREGVTRGYALFGEIQDAK